jgi:hypothetical protein
LHALDKHSGIIRADTGNSTLGQTRNGLFYFDAGACKEIINGNIKVEAGFIEFTEDKVILNGGHEKEFDLVVFETLCARSAGLLSPNERFLIS